MPASADQPVFYYDLGSPDCYLAAEQIMQQLPVVPEWQPVLALELGGARHRPSIAPRWSGARPSSGLQPVRWPARLAARQPAAMLAATYAKQIGRGVAFSLAAFRQAFAGGRDLGDRTRS